jgi:subtilisin-like proprotein convertase family protein
VTTAAGPRGLTAPLLAAVLTGGLLAAWSPPATAAQASFTQDHPIAVPDPLELGNNTPIDIPDAASAGLYPSTIEVDESARVSDVDVWLGGFTHANPDDVDILLVGPGGQQATLMSDAGGDTDADFVDFWIDEDYPTPLPDDGPIVALTQQPANYDDPSEPGGDLFPAPAPTPTGSDALAVFDGTDSQGTWSLYVSDDTPGDSGALEGGWRISIHVVGPQYPSEINVSGLPTRLDDVDVTLRGLTHSYPADLDVMLVGPHGQQATVMSDAGDAFSVELVEVTLDDEATAYVPGGRVPITTGRYRPTNLDTPLDPLPAPAPDTTGETRLSAFDGTDPNGTWRLYVVDDAPADIGTLAGWSLDFGFDDTAPTGTVVVDAGAPATDATSVTLSVSAADNGPLSTSVSQMRFSNDGVTFSAFQPYTTSAGWKLTSGAGAKTVYAQFQDAHGNISAPVSDTIVLTAPDLTGPRSTSSRPVGNARHVRRSAAVRILADEALAPATVTTATVSLRKHGSLAKVRAHVAYLAASREIVLDPVGRLARHTTYVVRVSSGVIDLAGNGWDQSVSVPGDQWLRFRFTTAGLAHT